MATCSSTLKAIIPRVITAIGAQTSNGGRHARTDCCVQRRSGPLSIDKHCATRIRYFVRLGHGPAKGIETSFLNLVCSSYITKQTPVQRASVSDPDPAGEPVARAIMVQSFLRRLLLATVIGCALVAPTWSKNGDVTGSGALAAYMRGQMQASRCARSVPDRLAVPNSSSI